MKKLFSKILVLGLLWSESVYAKEIYLKCTSSEKMDEHATKVSISEYLFDDRKVTLKKKMMDSYYEIKQTDGSVKRQQELYFPLTSIDNLPLTKIKEDETFYYLGGQLFGYQKKTYEEIIENNKKNLEKMQYVTLQFNKFTLDMIFTSYYYRHTYESMFNKNSNYPKNKNRLKKDISRTPSKCEIIKNKL